MQDELTLDCSTPAGPENNSKIPVISDVWGQLRRNILTPIGSTSKSEIEEEINLCHRFVNNKRDSYLIGRSRSSDILVEDKRVSSQHCLVYCDYSQAKLRVFIEDCSANGTYVNDSLTRLTKGERMELKSGFEIYLTNPRNQSDKTLRSTSFTFINIRERQLAQRDISFAPLHERAQSSSYISHIEQQYIIGDQIGSGMCGQVFFCVHRKSLKKCAIKIIDTRKFTFSPGLSIDELKEEARLMQQLDHPNIVKIFDTFHSEHSIHLVMELLTGGDLFDRIVERGRYSETNARRIMGKILSAVQYLHAKQIIHRDLKPENILLVDANDDTDIKITDFGLAKKANHDGLKTFCGTPQYFAPEVLKRKGSTLGIGRYGTSADMWSLGVVLYILLSGTFPFHEENLFNQVFSILVNK
jgi:phosphorylase kinase gamma subunit/serine/threonine-protein kinase Chk2/calcium/calmodulin-dependent protein kinase I